MSYRVCKECVSAIEEDYTFQVQAMPTPPNRTAVGAVPLGYFGDDISACLSSFGSLAACYVNVTISVAIRSLPDATLRARRPIPVTLILNEGIWTAEQTEFDICATGDTPEDAELSLAEYISEDFVHWRGVPAAQLSEDAKRLLARYREYIADR